MIIEHYIDEANKTIPQQQKWYYFVAENTNEDFLLGKMNEHIPNSQQGNVIGGHQSLAFTVMDLVYKVLEPKTIISED